MVKYIDATDHLAGRLASYVAKQALLGEKIVILNAEKAIISGKKNAIVEKLREKYQIGDPHKGPFWPRRPDRMLRRMIRGMLPYKQERGKKALRRVEVYIGVPDEFKNVQLEKVPQALKKKTTLYYVTLGEVAKILGGRWI